MGSPSSAPSARTPLIGRVIRSSNGPTNEASPSSLPVSSEARIFRPLRLIEGRVRLRRVRADLAAPTPLGTAVARGGMMTVASASRAAMVW